MIERALGIVGWMTPAELAWLAARSATCCRIAEVGSWRGRSTAALSDNTPGTVWAVDTWEGSPETDDDPAFASGGPEWLYAEFLRNAGPNVVAQRAESVEAAATFAAAGLTFDMVFIDSAHDYASIRADILAWRPLVRPGGVLCGHDYEADVKRAVDELLDASVAVDGIWEAAA